MINEVKCNHQLNPMKKENPKINGFPNGFVVEVWLSD